MPVIPPALLAKIQAFCRSHEAGTIVLHVHQHRIQRYAMTETGRVFPGAALDGTSEADGQCQACQGGREERHTP